MNPLELFGRHRNLAITSAAIPTIMEGIQSLEVVKIEGSESMETASFEYKVLLKTPAELSIIPTEALLQSFDLAAFIGKQATLHIALDDVRVAGINNTREITGIIASAQFKRVAERALHFEIILRDWLWLGTLNKDYAIHQNKSPVDTIKDTLNATYPYMFDVRLKHSYPIRDYAIRMGEDACSFIKRLCQEFSINLHYEHRNGSARLILTDSNAAFTPFPSPAYQTIRYHADTDFIDEEHWHTFSPSRNLTTGAVTYRDHDYIKPDATNEVSHNEPTRNRAGDAVNHGNFEQYHYHTDKFTNTVQPEAGTDGHNDPLKEGQVFTLNHLQSLQQHDDRSIAIGNVRGAVVGHTFGLINHPMLTSNVDYIVVEAKLLVEEVASETQRLNEAQQWRVETEVKLQPVNIPLRPNRTIKKPRVEGVEIARVVGYNDQNGEAATNSIWTDEHGRIKVAFPWSRQDPHNNNSSCWVRVASNDAGNQQGSMHIPRINDEVLISYIGGDPDLPICTGRVYNSTHMPPWTLPKNQALSGYRSRELKPGNQSDGRSNHILLDDSADAIQAQIKSDESHSSLSLGHITRVEDNSGRKDKRGTGLELRTDGHGAIRAASGLVITTQGRSAATSHITDLDEAIGGLKQGQSQHKSTGEVASEHKAFDENEDAKSLDETLKTQNEEVKSNEAANPSKGEFPELKTPHLVIHSPAGIETSTPQSTHLHSQEHIALTAGQHLSMSIGKRLLTSAKQGIRMFSQSMGIKMFAAKGKVEIQAQSNDLEIIAEKVLKLISAKKSIEIVAAEEILLTAKGSYIKINGNGIEEGTPAGWTVYSASKTLTGPKSLPYPLPKMPQFADDGQWLLYDMDTEKVLPNRKYRLIDPVTGKKTVGTSDDQGRVSHLPADYIIEVLPVEGKKHLDEVTEKSYKAMPADKNSIKVAQNITTQDAYIDKLSATYPTLKADVEAKRKAGYPLDAVPIVPDGARMIPLEALLNSCKKGQGKPADYKYLHFFSAADKEIKETIGKLIFEGRLPSQYFYIFGHGSPELLIVDGFKDKNIKKGQLTRSSLEIDTVKAELLKKMKDNGYTDGMTVVFLACQVGNTANPFAGVFAKQMKTMGTVYGSTSLMYYAGNTLFTCARYMKNHADQMPEKRIAGLMRLFNAAGIGEKK